jgi:hypothetical protein
MSFSGRPNNRALGQIRRNEFTPNRENQVWLEERCFLFYFSEMQTVKVLTNSSLIDTEWRFDLFPRIIFFSDRS